MCLISVKLPTGVLIRKEMKEAFRCNPDGAGFMYANDGKLIIKKGFFGFRKFYRAYREAERACPNSVFVLHYRVATHGQKDVLNCHPFQVYEGLGFAHNGVMNELGNNVISDSADLAWNYLGKLQPGFLEVPEIWNLVERLATDTGSKFAFLNSEGKYYIVNAKAGHWSKNVWHSNYSYVLATKTAIPYSNYNKAHSWYADETSNRHQSWNNYEECEVCRHYRNSKFMYQQGTKFYCQECFPEKEKVSCPNCYMYTKIDKSSRCEFCGELVSLEDIAFNKVKVHI